MVIVRTIAWRPHYNVKVAGVADEAAVTAEIVGVATAAVVTGDCGCLPLSRQVVDENSYNLHCKNQKSYHRITFTYNLMNLLKNRNFGVFHIIRN